MKNKILNTLLEYGELLEDKLADKIFPRYCGGKESTKLYNSIRKLIKQGLIIEKEVNLGYFSYRLK